MLVDCVLDLFLLLLDLWLDLVVVSVYFESDSFVVLVVLGVVLVLLVVVVASVVEITLGAVDGLVLDVVVPLDPDIGADVEMTLEDPDIGVDLDSGTVEITPDEDSGTVEITPDVDSGTVLM